MRRQHCHVWEDLHNTTTGAANRQRNHSRVQRLARRGWLGEGTPRLELGFAPRKRSRIKHDGSDDVSLLRLLSQNLAFLPSSVSTRGKGVPVKMATHWIPAIMRVLVGPKA